MKRAGLFSARRWFGLDVAEASFERRGFPLSSPARAKLEAVGTSFITGYNLALESSSDDLGARLCEVGGELRGFAFEGAAMAVTLLDLLTPWRARRLETLLEGAGAPYVHLIHVGAGWALARLKRSPRKLDRSLDPLLKWLALDGYGFHEGFFSWPRSIVDRAPSPFSGYAARVYDQGLGRSLWFVKGADVDAVVAAIGSFPVERRADLWSGVGLACTYAGGVPEEALQKIVAEAGDHVAHVAQGVCFAAEARRRAGLLPPSAELACRVIWGRDAATTCAIADECLPQMSDSDDGSNYELWRSAIRARHRRNLVRIAG